MMLPGSVTPAGDWNEPSSMARSIEQELIADELLDLADEEPESTYERRRSLTALTRGIVNYLRASMSIELDAGDIRAASSNQARVPAATKTFNVAANQISIGAGTLRATGDAESAIPPQSITLTGKVS